MPATVVITPFDVDLPDRVVVPVGDEEVTGCVEGEPPWRIQNRMRCRTAVTCRGADSGRPDAVPAAAIARAGDGLDEPIRRDLADPVVQVVRDEHVPCRVERQEEGCAEEGVGAVLSIPTVGADRAPPVIPDVLPVLVAGALEIDSGAGPRDDRRVGRIDRRT